MRRDDPTMRGYPADAHQHLLDKMLARSQSLNVSSEEFWESAIEILDPRDSINEYQLAMTLSRLHRHVNGIPSKIVHKEPEVNSGRRRSSRITTTPSARPLKDNYLSWGQIKPLWNAASFLPQQYGRFFNLRLNIRHGRKTVDEHAAGAKIVSDLTHQLVMRVNEWTGASDVSVHWAYRHEATLEGALVTRLALSVPEMHLDRVTAWIEKKFLVRNASAGTDISAAFRGANNSRRVKFHWDTVRALSRSLDPSLIGTAEAGGRELLVDILGIPLRWRDEARQTACSQSRGTSASLSPAAQVSAAANRMDFLSVFQDRKWSFLCSGWELEEYRDRQLEIAERRKKLAEINEFFIGGDDVTDAKRRTEIARIESNYPIEPEQRARSWKGWWQPLTRSQRKATGLRRVMRNRKISE